MGVAGRLLSATTRVQGVYYVATGVWPLVHMRSFEAITGPKRDGWLVKTVGLLIAVAGSAILTDVPPAGRSTRVIAAGSAAALAAVDVWYVARGRIRSVYLLDAAAELALLGGLVGGVALERPGDRA